MGKFSEIVSKYDVDMDLAAGSYVVDAKSILGVFSLNFFRPLTLTIHADKADDLLAELAPFIIE